MQAHFTGIRRPVVSIPPTWLGDVPIMGNLLNIVHHRIEHPLKVHFLFAS